MGERGIKIIVEIGAWFKRNVRSIAIWLILVTLFMLFETRISILLLKYNIIGQNEVNGRLFNLLYTAVKMVGVVLFTFLALKNYRLSKHLNFWFLFLAVTYLILRTNPFDELEFISISSDEEDKKKFFADVFVYLGCFSALLFIRNLFGDFKFYDTIKTALKKELLLKGNKRNSIYLEDVPIEGNVVTDNNTIVSTLANQIADLYPAKAFVIGINGEWGGGKTTFLKRLEYNLKFDTNQNEKTPIIFWFNAWQHQDEKSIINNFFNQLKKELAYYSGDAKTSINKYLGTLLALFDSNYSKGMNFISEVLSKNQSTIKDYYEDIDNIISRINRRVIILVDDLDRLNKNEIIEVIRILRNVANFKNTIFICGFDKNYVIKTGGFQNNFLDKIFNLEINLPKIHQNGLMIFFENIIKSSKGFDYKEKITETLSSIFDTYTDISLLDISIDHLVAEKENEPPKLSSIPLSPSLFFGTRRDIKRFYNSLVTNLKILGNIDDVEFEDYLLFQLLVFKYSWLFNHFGSNRINLWLGDKNTLAIKDDKLDFLDNQEGLELLDRVTIYSVLIRLFPNTSTNVQEEGSRKINQRRYLPIYTYNNVFNEAFSYTNLITAHSQYEIDDLIENRVIGNENETYLLNDIKSFILKEENLNSIEEFEKAIVTINKYLGGRVSDFELIQFMHIGEEIEGFKELAESKIFIDIDNVFGQFLRLLNMYYTRCPKDVSLKKNDLGNYLSSHKLQELSIVNQNYVKNKVVELYAIYLKEQRTINEASRILFDSTESHYEYFGLYLYYSEANELFKSHLKINFKSIFLDENPKEILRFFSGDLIAAVFVTDEGKEEIKKKADDIIKSRNQFSNSDLDKRKFLKDGWSNFLNFFRVTYSKMELSEDEQEKAEKFYAFVYTYIKKGFIIPTEQEVLVDEILNKMRKKDIDASQEEEQ